MATVTKLNILKAKTFGGVPFGNASRQRFSFATNTSGIWVDSNQTTAVGSTDVLRLGIIPAGTELHDMMLIVSTALAGSTTCKVGWLYVDGVDRTDVAQNDAYFVTATQALSSAVIIRKTATTAPVVLPKDAYLVMTMAGAAQTTTSALDVIIEGIQTGSNV